MPAPFPTGSHKVYPADRTLSRRVLARWLDPIRRRQERRAARQACARIARQYPVRQQP